MKTQVNIKLDTDIKNKAQKAAKELGLSLSSVVNASLKQFARTGELHVSVAPKMTPYLENLVREAREDYTKGKVSGPFNSVAEFKRHLERRA